LIGYLVDWLLGSLIGCLVRYLVDWFNEIQKSSNPVQKTKIKKIKSSNPVQKTKIKK
jgi:hypothetical protein